LGGGYEVAGLLFELNPAFIGIEVRKRTHKNRFAGTRWTTQADDFPRTDGKIDGA